MATPEIEAVSLSGNNFPFSIDRNRAGLNYEGRIPEVNRYLGDEDYAKVLSTQPIEGRWFTRADASQGAVPVVINRKLRERMFGDRQAIGKTFYADREDKIKLRVVGVIPTLKDQGNFQGEDYSLYQYLDTALAGRSGFMLVRISPEAKPDFESKLFKMVSGSLVNPTVEITHLKDMRTSANTTMLIPVIVLSIVAGFLVINVALGLFGVLWQNISTRQAEIGLRRSIGASSNQIYRQIITEAAILVTLAVVPGAIIVSQLGAFDVINITPAVYMASFAISGLVIYCLVIACALYPATIASRISPSEALHAE
jgi:putative ABC transport system permease protein